MERTTDGVRPDAHRRPGGPVDALPTDPEPTDTRPTDAAPTDAVLDRAAGAVIGSAAGDALGAGYEFGPPLPDDARVGMVGGGTFAWAPGEWTDDTSMAVAVLRALAAGEPLDDDRTLDGVVDAWCGWAVDAKDVGNQTRAVLGGLAPRTAAAARRSARAFHDTYRRSGGNGSLMRTGPVALAYLGDGREGDLARAARAVSDLTHAEDDAGDACVLWSLAVRHAIRTGVADVRVGLPWLPATRRDPWAARIADAEVSRPRDFDRNGWVVEALQAAWSAITHGTTLVDVLERAVRGGRDTDTVAAIAGALVGARDGASAVPAAWRDVLHGWPGLDAAALTDLAARAVRR
ncbi:ADP-ribosylglycohydrolase family protein [Cellulomonas sp. HD19AZ1]|nr:ADP-ribosylglycohydrolase family protein [Cellulomonas sp. HD19AZ1]